MCSGHTFFGGNRDVPTLKKEKGWFRCSQKPAQKCKAMIVFRAK